MIVEKLLELVQGVLSVVLGWLPGHTFTPDGAIGDLLGSTAGRLLSQWLDLVAMSAAIAVILGGFAVAATIKGVRILISHLTGGGGSAA